MLNLKKPHLHDDTLYLIFVSETCLGTDDLPQLEGYQVIANPKVKHVYMAALHVM